MGRPIAWVGDPNSPDLTPQVQPTSGNGWCFADVQAWQVVVQKLACSYSILCAEQERRRIKRRIANRESARRVRARRQDMLEEMIEKVRSRRLSGTRFRSAWPAW